MKRTATLLLAALLFCAAIPVLGQAADGALPMDLFRGRVGRVLFSLPPMPQRIADQDYPGLWKNSVQLFGNSMDGAEFQLRTADIGEWIEGYQKEWPDAEPMDWRVQALLGYALFMIRTYQGEYANVTAREEEGLVLVEYSYTYPDSPGVEYRGKAILDGTLAVSLNGEVSPQMNQVFEQLKGLSVKEAEKLPPPTPKNWALGSLSAVFPDKVYESETNGSVITTCYGADFSLLVIQAFPLGVRLPELTGKALEDELVRLAEKVMLPNIQSETVYAPIVSLPVEDTMMLAFESVNTVPYGEEYGQRFLGRLYLGARGVYYVWAADTETGRAFMESLKVTPLE